MATSLPGQHNRVSDVTKNADQCFALKPRCHREEDPVAVVELRPSDLPPQDGQLVAQYHQLQVLGTLGAEAEEHKRQDASSEDVDDGQSK